MQRVRSCSLAVLLAFGTVAGCWTDRVTGSETGTAVNRPVTPPAPWTPSFPTVPSGAVVYDRVSSSSLTGRQRFVLFANGAFSLQFVRENGAVPSASSFEYAGRFSRADSVVKFEFAASNTAGAWTATAVVHGDSLSVEFNVVMQLADFEDGLYVHAPQPTGGEQIYLMGPDGAGTPTLLTRGGWPSWSRDGKRIAFHRDGRVCVIDVDRSNESCLVDGTFPTLSPDGHSIAFTSLDGIAVMNGDGSNVRTLIRHDFRTDTYAPWDMGVSKPAWSPDGHHIAFEHLGDGDMQPAQIFVMKADGSEVRRLTESDDRRRYAESDPAWSADGTRIVFWSYGYGIASAPASGGVPTSIYMDFPAVAYGTRPAPSPDGLAVTYTVRDWTSGATSIWLRPGGRLVENGRDAAWSPDGKWIAYVSGGQ